jgi:arginine-tRNA-protein transferase
VSPDRLRLFSRFHEHGHRTKGWPAGGTDLDLFVANPFPVEEWSYRVDGKLIAVGYADVLPGALSAIYFYWDPDEKRRSLGTFNILNLISSAARRNMPHVYLGYYVEGCRSLEYKGRFRPNEIIGPQGEWIAFKF